MNYHYFLPDTMIVKGEKWFTQSRTPSQPSSSKSELKPKGMYITYEKKTAICTTKMTNFNLIASMT